MSLPLIYLVPDSLAGDGPDDTFGSGGGGGRGGRGRGGGRGKGKGRGRGKGGGKGGRGQGGRGREGEEGGMEGKVSVKPAGKLTLILFEVSWSWGWCLWLLGDGVVRGEIRVRSRGEVVNEGGQWWCWWCRCWCWC